METTWPRSLTTPPRFALLRAHYLASADSKSNFRPGMFLPRRFRQCLVAMNPAALKTNIKDLKNNGILIVNSDSSTANDLRKAQMTSNPLEDHSLDGYRPCSPSRWNVLPMPRSKSLGLTPEQNRCKNFFSLGMCYWLYNRSMDHTFRWLDDKFKNKPLLAEANKRAMKAGHSYCEMTEAFQVSYEIRPPSSPRARTAI